MNFRHRFNTLSKVLIVLTQYSLFKTKSFGPGIFSSFSNIMSNALIPQNFKCTKCSFSTGSQSNLYQHFSRKHKCYLLKGLNNQGKAVTVTKPASGLIPCSCGTSFSDKRTFKAHLGK